MKGNFVNTGGAVLVASLFAVSTPALAQSMIWSAPEAQNAMENDQVLMLDIRSPGEWDETGIAQGALPVSMHTPDFSTNLTRILAQSNGRKIALICATGGRTEYVIKVLEKNGISGLVDVSEGMIGNQRGPGWIARGLPVVDKAAALELFATTIRP